MQKLMRFFILAFVFLAAVSAEAATPSKIVRRQDTPFSDEMDVYTPRFERGLTQTTEQIQNLVQRSIENREKLQKKHFSFGNKTLTKYTVTADPGVLVPKNYKFFPKTVTFVGYYESLNNKIEGYCLLEAVFRSSNPELDSLSDLPSENSFLNLIDLKGRPLQVHYYEKKSNGNIEAYFIAEIYGVKILLLDCLMSETLYQTIKPEVATALNSLLDYYYHFYTLFS
ncbi:hypothetical protein COW36_11600 [bacterium (Candidatus Blackallbacteria) CG17_big_fil_post_rev_8_21_14_2_50_48_46]|uniref:Uncharacterized protein n=1 Tax=bacterium (Candidatus Blackallbacteria) CG17_big_fil_post_rev_8_21_14_2_50_48_46 TaxID=2014261 RepID=A0A2M7G4G4_9BACT|nr:MAG: hypothetical protein COW64_21820 [bacterium (Candidatus Blackallbacteria) CG18_big_fil_WC_8_21_14_2_50_49_26]PIW16782.1 MAG: hypothetical protein COW36_11600 [bacterium (Candidatus Blackallbacteria) CG17_big_fil_post_rev_8_21_14_2_50_48_46]PIW47074.1 MAG: hypothetical protein COW20_13820 [bacterium (Candidatus Blackallbacteria) CG13_big_fil_rev_8_21_14_2_50_49_14]